MHNEKAISFDVGQHCCIGIVHKGKGESCTRTGVLLIVGGPQYRVGSHRQFVQLSRALADAGIPSMRFDYRGMGDSQGRKESFEAIDDDIAQAIQAFHANADIDNVVIWGLCDAASAAMIYASKDDRVKGLILLNPWLENSGAKGQTMLRHYYLKRLFSKAFWKKLVSGGVNLSGSLRDAGGHLKDSVSKQAAEQGSYQQRMQNGFNAFGGTTLLVLSGVDLTAREFEQQALGIKGWTGFKNEKVQIHRISDADHTFSCQAWKREVEKLTVNMVMEMSQV
ncbi:hydrolase 1, exosortase A system-associated [Bowmanella sp. Y26]|uniref:hydrolase 1, exosortase A system-associated n=1 Tax=Bowmanella yangjiangensis TaxID=2811230 RepID=UPI001BDC7A8D|nr:hydrolase 1, exosortase A system-associated [Bowmanella yangjiangensis]MBT1064853.1 hydrolase 1, exosortase A system-associated [Bowmanella yangjiangensis]